MEKVGEILGSQRSWLFTSISFASQITNNQIVYITEIAICISYKLRVFQCIYHPRMNWGKELISPPPQKKIFFEHSAAGKDKNRSKPHHRPTPH